MLLRIFAVIGLAMAHSSAAAAAEERVVQHLRLEGNVRTRHTAIAALLPRELPTELTARELEEFDRRVRNLGIFDEVYVAIEGTTLKVQVREKFTLSPVLGFASGATWVDSYVQLGATEFNLLGTASALSVFASWEQRGPTLVARYAQHPYARGRLGVEVTAYFVSADFRFDPGDADAVDLPGWLRRQTGLDVFWKAPFAYQSWFRLQAGFFALYEWSTRVSGLRAPEGGLWAGAAVTLEADRYTFSDYVPRGFRSTLELFPSVLLPSMQPRPEAISTSLAALPLWRLAVLAMRVKLSGVWGGNVNHSVLLGSLEGVRGLADAFYRNRAQAFANIEVRQTVPLARRWAVQTVVFADAGAFQPLAADGGTQASQTAAGVGAGLRLVPSFLTGIVLRTDLSKPLQPHGNWFFQLGLSQYF